MAAGNVASEIEKLDELRTKGIITDKEFESQKAALLSPQTPSEPEKAKRRPGMFLVWLVLIIAMIAGAVGSGGDSQQWSIIMIGVMIGLFIYLLPAFIAYERAHANRHAILLINLLFGWSVIGWIGSLVWSVTSSRTHATSSASSSGGN